MQTAVKDTSLIALKTFEELETDHERIIKILEEIGPAHDLRILEAINQQEQKNLKPKYLKRFWHINQIAGRRNELVKMGLVRDIGIYKGIWGGEKKIYHFWAVAGDRRQPAGWVRLPDRPHKPPQMPEKCVKCQYRIECLRMRAERPITAKLDASQAGSVLGKFGHNKTKQTTTAKETLFAI